MMTLPIELASAVVASPDDDAPRLACAAWLDEHDRADEAEYVRVQVALARAHADRPPGWRKLADALGERAAELEAATEAARLGPLLERCQSGELEVFFQRGFADFVQIRCVLTPELMRELAALPTLAMFAQMPRHATAIGPEDVPLLAAIPGLELVVLRLARDGLTWEHLEPLLALPRLGRPTISPGFTAESVALAVRWRRERAAAARAIADPVAAARLAFGGRDVAVGPRGDAAAYVSLDPIQADAIAVVSELAAIRLDTPTLPRGFARAASVRSLELYAWGRTRVVRSATWRAPPGLRELRVTGYDGSGPAVRSALTGQPGLRSLVLDGLSAAQLPALPELRVLTTPLAGHPDDLAGVGWPRLLEWRCPARLTALARLDPRRCPELRLLSIGPDRAFARPAGGWGATLPAPVPLAEARSAALSADARRVTVPGEGVSLTIPEWFADAPLPPPDPRTPGVVPLAAWREWGDAGDDLASDPPTRGLLERLDGPLDTGAALSDGVLPRFAEVHPGEVAEVGGRLWQAWSGTLAHLTAGCVRQVWRTADGRAFRLTWEGGSQRLLSPDAVAAFVGDSLECEPC